MVFGGALSACANAAFGSTFGSAVAAIDGAPSTAMQPVTSANGLSQRLGGWTGTVGAAPGFLLERSARERIACLHTLPLRHVGRARIALAPVKGHAAGALGTNRRAGALRAHADDGLATAAVPPERLEKLHRRT